MENGDGGSVDLTMFECAVCCKPVLKDNTRMLPCLHSICSGCCDCNEVFEETVSCAFCHKNYDIKSVQHNFMLKVVEEARNVQKCNGCDENIPALYQCVDCNGDFLCKVCVEAHKRVRITKEHRLNEIIKADPINDICPVHSEEKWLFCVLCCDFFCAACDSSSHNGHKTELSENGIKLVQSQLVKMLSENNSEISELSSSVELRLKELNDDRTKMEDQVEEYTKAVAEVLEFRKNRILSRINQECSKQQVAYESQKYILNRRHAYLNFFKEFIESSDTCPNKILVTKALTIAPQIMQSVEQLKKTETVSGQEVNKVTRFELKSSKSFDQLLKEIMFDGSVLVNGAIDKDDSFSQSRASSPILPPTLSPHVNNIFDQHSVQTSSAKRPSDKGLDFSKRKFNIEGNGHVSYKENLKNSPKRACYGRSSGKSAATGSPAGVYEFTDDDGNDASSVDGSYRSYGHDVDVAINEDKEWDEFCVVCQKSDSDDLLKCVAGNCTRTFHRYDHIPPYRDDQIENGGLFICGFCQNYEELKTEEDKVKKEKRKSTKMTRYERAIADRILLELYCFSDSEPFHNPVDNSYQQYFTVISRPIAFSDIRDCLKNKKYKVMETFLNDLNQVFANCYEFYKDSPSGVETYEQGKRVGKFFLELVEKFIPNYLHLCEVSKDGDYTPRILRSKP